MTLNLPAPSEARLPRSPLQTVVCQVRHEALDESTLKGRARAIRDQLKDAYPTLRPAEGGGVVVSGAPSNVTVGQELRWQLNSGDGSWTAIVANDFFALETTQYLDWDDFRSRLEDFVSAVLSTSDIAVELRVGLRYVDRLHEPTALHPADWSQWIRPAFVGPLADESLGPATTSFQGITQFDGGDETRANLRYGCFLEETDKRWAFVLDHDCFRETGDDLTLDGLMATLEQLHTLALQLFQAAITPAYFEYLSEAGS